MPLVPGEYADILRAVGRLLDRVGAHDVEITNHDAFVSISWQSRAMGSDQRNYQDHDLDELRHEARQARTGAGQEPRGGFAELLRTLGQDLDQIRGDFSQIVQQADGFLVSGAINGRYARQKYLTADLLASSRRRRQLRRGGPFRRPDAPRPGAGRLPLQGGSDPSAGNGGSDEGPLSRRLRS